GGTLTCTGDLTVTKSLIWSGGIMRGAGTTTIASGARLTVPGVDSAVTLDGRTLNNAGTTIVSGAYYINVVNGGMFANLAGATFDLQGNITQILGDARSSFLNAGTLLKSGGIGITPFYNLAFTNTGTVDVQKGTLALQAGGASTAGAFIVENGAVLDFAS